eukprot:jgi/Bigna1/138051/aug1.42_g12759
MKRRRADSSSPGNAGRAVPAKRHKTVRQWTVKDVVEVIVRSSQDLKGHENAFWEAEVDGEALLGLDDSALRSMGLSAPDCVAFNEARGQAVKDFEPEVKEGDVAHTGEEKTEKSKTPSTLFNSASGLWDAFFDCRYAQVQLCAADAAASQRCVSK